MFPLVLAAFIALSPAGGKGPEITATYHFGLDQSVQVVFTYTGLPAEECPPEGTGGVRVELAFVAIPRQTVTCTRPDGTLVWSRTVTLPAQSSVYSYCSEYFQWSHSAMIHRPGNANVYPLTCPYPIQRVTAYPGVFVMDMTTQIGTVAAPENGINSP